jgi:hypothetical protein
MPRSGLAIRILPVGAFLALLLAAAWITDASHGAPAPRLYARLTAYLDAVRARRLAEAASFHEEPDVGLEAMHAQRSGGRAWFVDELRVTPDGRRGDVVVFWLEGTGGRGERETWRQDAAGTWRLVELE